MTKSKSKGDIIKQEEIKNVKVIRHEMPTAQSFSATSNDLPFT
jgi:hypothetical protein